MRKGVSPILEKRVITCRYPVPKLFEVQKRVSHRNNKNNILFIKKNILFLKKLFTNCGPCGTMACSIIPLHSSLFMAALLHLLTRILQGLLHHPATIFLSTRVCLQNFLRNATIFHSLQMPETSYPPFLDECGQIWRHI